MTKKDQAFILFDEGKTPTSLEVKALKLKGSTRYNYYYDWQKSKGITRSSSGSASGAKGSGKAISELEMVIPKEVSESEEEEQGVGESKGEEPGVSEAEEGESEPEDEEEGRPDELDKKPEKKEKPSDNGKKSPPGMVAGQGLTFGITISTKTLMLYQIAASHQTDELTLGDFIDTCVEDTYRGRGLDLGLVKIGGAKK